MGRGEMGRGEMWQRKVWRSGMWSSGDANQADRLRTKEKGADVRAKIGDLEGRKQCDRILVGLIGELESCLSRCLRLRPAHSPKRSLHEGKQSTEK